MWTHKEGKGGRGAMVESTNLVIEEEDEEDEEGTEETESEAKG